MRASRRKATLVCTTDLSSSGVEVLAARVAHLLPERVGEVWSIGRSHIAETSHGFRRQPSWEKLMAMIRELPDDSPVVFFGLTGSQKCNRELLELMRPRRSSSTLLLEAPGITPIELAQSYELDGANIVTLSPIYLEQLRDRLPHASVCQVALAIPEAFFLATNETQTRQITFTGRSAPSKGLPLLLEWWRQSKHRAGSTLSLVINAVDTLSEELTADVEELGVRVEQLNTVGRRAEIAAQSLACIFPAHRDHLPQAMVEAMAAGGLVICSDIVGHTGLATNGENAIVIDGDLEELDKTLDSTLNGRCNTASIRRVAREIAWERHGPTPSRRSWNTVLDLLED